MKGRAPGHIITVDLEDWFHILDVKGGFSRKSWSALNSKVEKNTLKILDLLDGLNVKATFFCLGFVAEKNPDLIREISSKGHEIASHGESHELIYRQDLSEFRDELKRAKQRLEDLTNKKVFGFRAPGFSITDSSMNALRILAEEGFLYDSSLFPAKRGHGGIKGDFPDRPFRFKFGEGGDLTEFPITPFKVLGISIPFSGGGYLRLFPAKALLFLFGRMSEKGRQAVLYFHPREFDGMQPRMNLPLKRSFMYYFNVASAEEKIRFLLENHEFKKAEDFIFDREWLNELPEKEHL
ncbi:MAG: polysaccharide deacetylase family protein [Deltaproteobacteria bacterium]|nr:polysaccharide deacetylase family protein [Deltaproteobacteria bacterium]